MVQDLSLATGGLATAALGLAEAQAAQGHAVAIAASDADGAAYVPLGVTVHSFACRLAGWRWAPGLTRFLRRHVRTFDIVHLQGLWQFPTLAAAAACREAGVPYAVSSHGMLDPWSLAQRAWRKRIYLRLLEARTLRAAGGLHATSVAEACGAGLQRWNPHVFVLPNGVPKSAVWELPEPAMFRARFPDVDQRRIVLFLGRLHYKKQPGALLRAFAAVASRMPDLHLVLAGPGPAEFVAQLSDLAASLAVEHRVLFTGPLSGAMVQAAYRAAAVFVLPSLQENFGNAVAEAMAAACPVVVSDQVALASEVQASNAGVVCAPTVEATARGIEAVLADETQRQRMGENGRQLVLERLAWDRVGQQYCAVYDDIRAGRRTSPAWWPTC